MLPVIIPLILAPGLAQVIWLGKVELRLEFNLLFSFFGIGNKILFKEKRINTGLDCNQAKQKTNSLDCNYQPQLCKTNQKAKHMNKNETLLIMNSNV